MFLFFLLQGKVGFNLWDEGFLWYGVQRTFFGEVPILDFMAYDPGRYWYSAFFMKIMGDSGIVTLRISIFIFQTLGLFSALYFLRSCLNRYSFLNIFYFVCSASVFTVWMFPQYKVYDMSASIFLVAATTFVIEKPSNLRYFLMGVVLGGVAIIGRNHGLYGAVGNFLAILYLTIFSRKDKGQIRALDFLKAFRYWVSGVLVGYSPLIFYALYNPDFGRAFYENILYMFEIKTTNLSLPVPWPWKVRFDFNEWADSLARLFVGIFFVLLPCLEVMGVISFFSQKVFRLFWGKIQVSPVLAAATFIGFPYLHYMFSRADIYYLAFAIFPFLIAVLYLLGQASKKIKFWGTGIFLWISCIMMFPIHPFWQCYSASRQNIEWPKTEVGRDVLTVEPWSKQNLDLVKKLVDQYACRPRGVPFLTIPFWPGGYALFEIKSPIWEVYPLWKRSEDFEKKEIERIKKFQPRFILLYDIPLDRVEERRYRKTHPLTIKYIEENFYLKETISQNFKLYLPPNRNDRGVTSQKNSR